MSDEDFTELDGLEFNDYADAMDSSARYWATEVMNQRVKFADVPEHHKERVKELCTIRMDRPLPPIRNFTAEYRPTEVE